MKWIIATLAAFVAAYLAWATLIGNGVKAQYADALGLCASDARAGAAKLQALRDMHGNPGLPAAMWADVLICQSQGQRETIGRVTSP